MDNFFFNGMFNRNFVKFLEIFLCNIKLHCGKKLFLYFS